MLYFLLDLEKKEFVIINIQPHFERSYSILYIIGGVVGFVPYTLLRI